MDKARMGRAWVNKIAKSELSDSTKSLKWRSLNHAPQHPFERVALVEAAGRKQVTMLMPVVALILPVALVFAFFPGVVAIRNLS